MEVLRREGKRIKQQTFIDKDICIDKLQELEDGLKLATNFPEPIFHLERDTRHSIWDIHPRNRWYLYGYWINKLAKKLKARLPTMKRKYEGKASKLQDVIDDKKLLIMKQASVVGMTTTGAASSWKLMQKLSPTIVIVEEAAEILEAHVITSLTRNCQHLIMIGDHQQLKPNPTVYEIATKFHLDTSLFERLIKNGLPYETLQYQHRMRPEISKLLVPSIYPTLKDDDSVQYYPNVKGMAKNVFFISHSVHQNKSHFDSTIHENPHEADFIMSLCRYLLLQGYSSEDITILTPYTGQLFLLKAIQNEETIYKKVRICVVDSFQGEESNIILLSLVRSNEEGNVGFLKIENRICVALSRAKYGFYIIGDMDMLCASCHLWEKIKNELLNQDAVGDKLPLSCQIHENEITEVSSGEEFRKLAPDGGCSKPCSETLPECGHPCPKTCHRNKSHMYVKCTTPCLKKLCDAGHLCQKTIHEECDKICNKIVIKELPCGDIHTLACHVDPNEYHCHELVQRMLPKCLHIVEMFCHQDPDYFSGCSEFCEKKLDCGHPCIQTCHVEKDPNHEEYKCLKPCTRINKECSVNHVCQKNCYQICGKCIVKVKKIGKCGHEQIVACHMSPDEIKCKKKCDKELDCGHICQRKCYEECGGCPVMVKKVVSICGHEIEIACCESPEMKHCMKNCPFVLDCGHKCQRRCCDKCETDCPVLVKTENRCPRNHLVKIPCHLKKTVKGKESWSYCSEPCRETLDCGHRCSGTCSKCLYGRFHVSCKKPCSRKLICGHKCQQMCIEECSKCFEPCGWKCSHKKCQHPCDEDCDPCLEWCSLRCKHHKCRSRCGDVCNVPPCTRPCDKKLDCGHPCLGYCGDPCPTICRTCNKGQIRGKENCRYICLEDCLNDIEVSFLKKKLKSSYEMGLKSCPQCGVTIRSNRHFSNIIKGSYRQMMDFKKWYFDSQTIIKKIDIKIILQDEKLREFFPEKVKKLMDDVGMNYLESTEVQTVDLTHKQLKHMHTQALFLKTVYPILNTAKEDYDEECKYNIYNKLTENESEDIDKHVRDLARRVLSEEGFISSQMLKEIASEVQRLRVQKPLKMCISKLKAEAELDILDKIEVAMEAAIKDKLKNIKDGFLQSIFECSDIEKTLIEEFVETAQGKKLVNIFTSQEKIMSLALNEQLVEISGLLFESLTGLSDIDCFTVMMGFKSRLKDSVYRDMNNLFTELQNLIEKMEGDIQLTDLKEMVDLTSKTDSTSILSELKRTVHEENMNLYLFPKSVFHKMKKLLYPSEKFTEGIEENMKKLLKESMWIIGKFDISYLDRLVINNNSGLCKET